jgi:hypothetical protein
MFRRGPVPSVYEMTFGEIEDYKEIAVSTTMIRDHLPKYYFSEINRLARERLGQSATELTV